MNKQIIEDFYKVIKTARVTLKSIKVAQVQKAFEKINHADFKIEVVEKLQKCENDRYKTGKEVKITVGKQELTYHTSEKLSAWQMTCWLEGIIKIYISKN